LGYLDKHPPASHHSIVLYQFRRDYVMVTYACNKYGLAVNTSCAKCDVALVDNSLELSNGNKLQIPSRQMPQLCGQNQIAKLLW
jgi:hypothetical protein